MTVEDVEKAVGCSLCGRKNITNTQIFYVGNSDPATQSSDNPKNNNDF